MRLLQILHGNEAGGVKTLSDEIGGALAARGFVVETAYLFPPDRGGLAGKAAGIARVSRLILEGRYDGLVAYQSSASLMIGLVGAVTRCRCRIVHQTALPGEVRAPLRWLDRIAGACGLYTVNVANSRATWAAFARYPARYRRSMVLIEHGVPVPVPRRTRAETLERFAIPDGGAMLLNVGRLAAQKNQGVLIAALPRLPGVRLVVAGGGPLRARHEMLARDLGVGDRLHLLGDVDRQDVADLLGAADVFVFPSVWESFGLAVVEAAALGLPIVASDLPVLREVLAGAGNAVSYAPSREIDAWVETVRNRLAAGPQGFAGSAAGAAPLQSVGRMIESYLALLGPDARAPARIAKSTRLKDAY